MPGLMIQSRMAESQERIDNRGKLVCVTGASGFIGTHVVRELLARGYRVRATVRDASDTSKVAHLRELADGAEQPLEIVSADLMDDGCFDEPFSGCEYICHVAASVRLAARDPQREIVDVAVRGTENALQAAARAGTVKRFVLTSSVAAIFDINARPDHVYSEADWCTDATLKTGPYPLAKTLSEKRAWEFAEEQDRAFEVFAINPAMVLGPVYTETHLRTSPSIARDLLTGKFPATPKFHFGIIDVRDVAAAHAEVLEQEGASGRYLLYAKGQWLRDLAATIRAHFPGYKKVPRRDMPNFMMYGVALFDKRLSWSFLRRALDRTNKVDNSKVVEQLGLELISAEQSVIDTCQSIIDRGFVKS